MTDSELDKEIVEAATALVEQWGYILEWPETELNKKSLRLALAVEAKRAVERHPTLTAKERIQNDLREEARIIRSEESDG